MDQDILGRALNNDLNAFGTLVEEYQDSWIRLAMSMLGRKEDALDAFQEGLIQLHRSIKTFRREASFKTWSSKIMINTFLRQRKQLSRRREREMFQSDHPDFNRIANGASTDDGLLNAERTQALRYAIGRLPEKQQMAVVLKYDGQMTVQEVADTLGLHIGTVKCYLHRAMEKLRIDLIKYFK